MVIDWSIEIFRMNHTWGTITEKRRRIKLVNWEMCHTALKLSESFEYISLNMNIDCSMSPSWSFTTKDNSTDWNHIDLCTTAAITTQVSNKDASEINPPTCSSLEGDKSVNHHIPHPFTITIRGLALIRCLFWSDVGFIVVYNRGKPVSQLHLCVHLLLERAALFPQVSCLYASLRWWLLAVMRNKSFHLTISEKAKTHIFLN